MYKRGQQWQGRREEALDLNLCPVPLGTWPSAKDSCKFIGSQICFPNGGPILFHLSGVSLKITWLDPQLGLFLPLPT